MSELYLRYVLVVAEYRYICVGLKGYVFNSLTKKSRYMKAEEDCLYLMKASEMCRTG